MEPIIKSKYKSDDWATPEYIMQPLQERFNFNFDPCPLHADFDGLTIEWGTRNFINPPYSTELRHAFIKKSVTEALKGKLCVMLLPCRGFSTKIFHDYVLKYITEPIYFFKGRIQFKGYNSAGVYLDRTNPRHDSMLVVFDYSLL